MRNNLWSVASLFVALSTVGFATCPTLEAGGEFVPPGVLAELSGLAGSLRHKGILYSHNDSGDTARFFALTTEGVRRATFVVQDVTAVDWEDMAVADRDGVSCIYLADTGNNSLSRTELTVHRVAEPPLPASNQTVTIPLLESIRIRFPGRNEDVEGLAVEPGTGALVLATRDRDGDGFSRIYRVFPVAGAVSNEAILIRSLPDPPGGFKTKAADWLPGRHFAILQHSSDTGATRMLLWPADPEKTLDGMLQGAPCVFPLADFEQAEALSLTTEDGIMFVGGEGGEDPVRSYQLIPGPNQSWEFK